MGASEKVTLERVGWTNLVERCLLLAANEVDKGDPGSSVDFYRQAFDAGSLFLIEVSFDAEPVGAVACRVDWTVKGMELCIVGAGAIRQSIDLVGKVLPHLEYAARLAGCRSVRFHTLREGLGRKVEKQGYDVSEVVYRRWLPEVSRQPNRAKSKTTLSGTDFTCDAEGVCHGRV